MKPPFRHLKRRRLLVWLVALVLIAGFGTAIGGIFWLVRMKTTYSTTLTPVGEGIFLAPVTSRPLQVFRTGDPAGWKMSNGEELSGVLRGVASEKERIELRLEFPGLPDRPASGEITIRSQRLLAAFLSTPPARGTDVSGQ